MGDCARSSPAFPICRMPASRWAAAPKTIVEVRRWGTPPKFDFTAKAALGSGPGARHSGSGARGKNHRRALRCLLGPGREAGARADQFHARRAHARARLHRSAAAVPGEFGVCTEPANCRNSRRTCSSAHGEKDLWLMPTAEVPVTNLYRDEDARCGTAADLADRLHAMLPQRGGILWAATCAASSGSISFRRWNW